VKNAHGFCFWIAYAFNFIVCDGGSLEVRMLYTANGLRARMLAVSRTTSLLRDDEVEFAFESSPLPNSRLLRIIT